MAGMEKYDPALLGILQNEGQISNFLDIILGFLYRRTDFYMLMKSKTDKLGFPPGIAAKLLLTTYKKYEDLARKADIEKQRNSIVEETENIGDAPVAVEMVEVESEPALPRCSVVEIEDDHNTATPSAGPVLTSTGPTRESADTPSSAAAQSQPATGGQEKDGDTPSYSADSECYNGAVRDTYSWSQTIADCDIRVKVPPSVKKGANVKVTVKKKHVCVCYREAGEEWVTAMDGPLTWDVRSDEVIWSLVPGEHIHINLEKVQERWWEAVLEGEPKINVRKIDASRPYTDLDEEAQAKISEMMYNEQQKRLGLPQSHEQSTQEMLRKAWNAKGSPFAGQPFDPSKVSVDPSGMVNINS